MREKEREKVARSGKIAPEEQVLAHFTYLTHTEHYKRTLKSDLRVGIRMRRQLSITDTNRTEFVAALWHWHILHSLACLLLGLLKFSNFFSLVGLHERGAEAIFNLSNNNTVNISGMAEKQRTSTRLRAKEDQGMQRLNG